MFEKWEVKVRSGLNTIIFNFNNSEEATMFSKLALMSVQNDVNSEGNVLNSVVKISASADKKAKEDK